MGGQPRAHPTLVRRVKQEDLIAGGGLTRCVLRPAVAIGLVCLSMYSY